MNRWFLRSNDWHFWNPRVISYAFIQHQEVAPNLQSFLLHRLSLRTTAMKSVGLTRRPNTTSTSALVLNFEGWNNREVNGLNRSWRGIRLSKAICFFTDTDKSSLQRHLASSYLSKNIRSRKNSYTKKVHGIESVTNIVGLTKDPRRCSRCRAAAPGSEQRQSDHNGPGSGWTMCTRWCRPSRWFWWTDQLPASSLRWTHVRWRAVRNRSRLKYRELRRNMKENGKTKGTSS